MSSSCREAAHWEKSSLRKGFVALEEIRWAIESPWQEIFKHVPEEHGDGWSRPRRSPPIQVRGYTSVVKHWGLLKFPELQVFGIERNILINV